MIDIFTKGTEVLLLLVLAGVVSWSARRLVRVLTRRAVRRAQVRPGTWRVRLRRIQETETDVDSRRRQRADAAARMIGHYVTTVVFIGAALVGLQVVGVDPVYAISSAGFVGLALALSGQGLIRDVLSGTMALLEDRYAVGDQVMISIAGTEVRGTIDLIGPASLRVRTDDGATWHAGHAAIECVTNFSQLPASAEITMSTAHWVDVEDVAAQRLTTASNDIGLTGVVFLPDLATQQHPAGVTTVTVRTNRPLTDDQKCLVRDRLANSADTRTGTTAETADTAPVGAPAITPPGR